MSIITLPVTCPRCDAHVDIVNHGTAGRTQLVAVLGCTGCGLECGLHVRLVPIDGQPITPTGCGTFAGYSAHRRNGQAVCDDCRLARNEWMRNYKAARRTA